MAERWRQMFRPAAISLIHPQNVESGLACPLGNAQHVRRLARTLQAVHEHQCAMAAPPLLPVAFREKSRSRLDLKQTVRGRRQACEIARPVGRRDGRKMRIPEQRVRIKWPCSKPRCTLVGQASRIQISGDRAHLHSLETRNSWRSPFLAP